MIFRRKKELILDCYTCNHYAYNFAKINHGIHFIPEWWKNTPRGEYERNSKQKLTIKNCPAIVEYYKRGLVIPMWSEVRITLNPTDQDCDFIWESSNGTFETPSHPTFQFEKFAKEDGLNLKIRSPWNIKCREKVMFSSSQPIWNHRETIFDLVMLPGILDFKTQTSTNMNYFYSKSNKNVTIEFAPLTPMVILHPLSEDRKIVLRHHYIPDEKKYRSMFGESFGMFLLDKPSLKQKEKFFEKVDELNKDEVYKI